MTGERIAYYFLILLPVISSGLLTVYFIDGVLKYRFKSRKIVYPGALLFSAVMGVMTILTSKAEGTAQISPVELYTLLIYLAFFVFLVILMKGTVWKRPVVVLLAFFILTSFNEIFTDFREIIFSFDVSGDVGVKLCFFILFDLLVLALEAAFFVSIDRVRKKKDNVPLPVSVILLMFFFLSIFSSIFSMVLFGGGEAAEDYLVDYSSIDITRKVSLITIMLLGLFSVFIFFYIRVTRKERNDLRDLNAVNEELILEQTRYFEAAAKADTEVRAMKHDMKNNIQVMKLLLENKEYDELRDYLQEMGDSIQSAEVTAHTGDTIADAIITSKKAEASDKGIPLKVAGSFAGMEISPQDMCKILANLLDNAIEAASGEELKDLDEDLKTVQLDLKKTDKFFMISVTNPCAHEPLIEDGEMKTIKSDKKNHGFGIKNIKSAAENYGGELSYSTETKPYGCIVRSEILFPFMD